MSTRSYIGIELPDGKVKSIYVHSDGYVSGVGKTLVDNYDTFEKAIKLFDFGDCSSLGDNLEDCSFYSRDWNREEENNQTTTYNNEYLFWNSFKGDILLSIFTCLKMMSGQFRKCLAMIILTARNMSKIIMFFIQSRLM